MKLLAAAICALLAISAHAEENWDIDWSSVVPIEETPGFWEGRDINPAVYLGTQARSGRITGGEHVVPHAHPYQVGLLLRVSVIGSSGLCGGSLITNRAVLTAAHCPDAASSAQVVLGAHQITVNEPSQQRQTVGRDGYRIHGLYNRQNFNNDIAILILPNVVTLNSFVNVIAMPALGDTNLFIGQQALVSGWGTMSDNRSGTSQHLRFTQNPIITNEFCQTGHGSTVIDSTICMSGAGGRSACVGDSGGPITIASGNNRLQVGVVSFGSNAGCQRGFPVGAARMTSFRQWINGMLA